MIQCVASPKEKRINNHLKEISVKKGLIALFCLGLSLTAQATVDFTLDCDDGSGHWRKLRIDVNHPISSFDFNGDGVGDIPVEVLAETKISTDTVKVKEGDKEVEKLEWTYTLYKGMEGKVVFKGLDVGDHEVESGTAEVQLVSPDYTYLNGSYDCDVE
jgi:hypothetical protein